MFIRKKTVKGTVYYEVVKSYRVRKGEDKGKVRHRKIASLGTHPTIEEAWREAEPAYFKAKRAGKATEAAWKRLEELARAFERERGESFEREFGRRFAAEYRRRERAV